MAQFARIVIIESLFCVIIKKQVHMPAFVLKFPVPGNYKSVEHECEFVLLFAL